MKLSHLTSKILVHDLKKIVHNERCETTQCLHYLREVDLRKVYSDYKYSSLFSFCVKELGYSESSAQRRIVAARLLEEIPEIETKIEEGLLNLSMISEMNHHFKDQDTQTKKEALKEVEGLTKKECEKKLFELTGKEKPAKESRRRVSSTKVRVSLVLSDESSLLLEQVQALVGKKLSSDQLIQLMARAAIEKIEREKFKQTIRPRKASRERNKESSKDAKDQAKGTASKERDSREVKGESQLSSNKTSQKKMDHDQSKKESSTSSQEESLPPANVRRQISAAVKREVYRRDKKCTNCGSTHNLNYDHIHAFALGGASGIENIRLLCFHCNQRGRMRMGL